MSVLGGAWRRFWAGLRAVTGDDAYDRYIAHCRASHPGRVLPDRGAFYRAELDRRWRNVNRCC